MDFIYNQVMSTLLYKTIGKIYQRMINKISMIGRYI